MKISSACCIGNKNRDRDRECQDYVSVYNDDKIAVIAVADGASKANVGGHIASKLSAQLGVECMRLENFWEAAREGRKKDFFNMFAEYISPTFHECKHDINYLCSTLTMVAVRTDGSYLIMSIGDGAVVAFDQDLNPHVMVRPYNIGGEKNRTIFTINRTRYLEEGVLKIGNIYSEEILGFSAITDGAEYLIDYLYNGGMRFRKIAAAMYGEAGDDYVEELVNWLVERDEKSDDTTLAIMMDDEADIAEFAQNVLSNPTYYGGRRSDEEVKVNIPMDMIRPMHQPIVIALLERSLTAQELVNEGYCLYGHVLETMRQLIEDNIVVQENNVFRLSDQCFQR